MPRLRKETQDKILTMIGEGYSNVEISEEVGVSSGTVSRYKQKVPKKEVEPTNTVGLSSKSMRQLYNLQGMLGNISLDETVNEIYDYSIAIMKRKFDYDPESALTPSEVFELIEKEERKFRELKKGRYDSRNQKQILEYLGMKEDLYRYYGHSCDFDDYVGTFVDFVADYTLRYFHEVKNYYIEPFEGSPFLEGHEPKDWKS